MLHNLLVALFATAAGFTASGIIANIYRLLAKAKPDTTGERILYVGVMTVAGPSVLFDKAARAWRAKDCSAIAFWLAAAICLYWSFALGLFVLQIGLAI
ncbi:MAG TPA: hypothetical protein VLW75_12285 [Rhizomicrobium sp.]|nr:hypothetical protein [Rhizomicrobium sp.]